MWFPTLHTEKFPNTILGTGIDRNYVTKLRFGCVLDYTGFNQPNMQGVIMNAKHQYFKLNEDDILGIVSDYLSTQVDFDTFNSRLAFVENEDNEYRIIAAYVELEDESIDEIDLKSTFVHKPADFQGNGRLLNTSVKSILQSKYVLLL